MRLSDVYSLGNGHSARVLGRKAWGDSLGAVALKSLSWGEAGPPELRYNMISILLARITLKLNLEHKPQRLRWEREVKGKSLKRLKMFLSDDGGLDQSELGDVGRVSYFIKFYWHLMRPMYRGRWAFLELRAKHHCLKQSKGNGLLECVGWGSFYIESFLIWLQLVWF